MNRYRALSHFHQRQDFSNLLSCVVVSDILLCGINSVCLVCYVLEVELDSRIIWLVGSIKNFNDELVSTILRISFRKI